jgi:hypothetical protein
MSLYWGFTFEGSTKFWKSGPVIFPEPVEIIVSKFARKAVLMGKKTYSQL